VSQRIRIVTDSVADLLPETVQRLNIAVVPIYFSLDGSQYCDDGTTSRVWFYEKLQQQSGLPQTAAPSVADFLKVYNALVAQGAEEIIGLFMASRLSSLQAHARQAAHLVEGARVHVIDTRQVTMGIGWLAIAAAEAVAAGASVAEVRALVDTLGPRTFVLGMLDTLEYLHRGGRVSWVQSQIGTLLRLKPLIGYHHGEARLLGRVRTRRRALRWLVHRLSEAAPLERLALLHTGLPRQQLEAIKSDVAAYTQQDEVPVIGAGPVFCTHVGPHAVGFAVVQSATAPRIPWPHE
jgi:DegV family protein with EDD domain